MNNILSVFELRSLILTTKRQTTCKLKDRESGPQLSCLLTWEAERAKKEKAKKLGKVQFASLTSTCLLEICSFSQGHNDENQKDFTEQTFSN